MLLSNSISRLTIISIALFVSSCAENQENPSNEKEYAIDMLAPKDSKAESKAIGNKPSAIQSKKIIHTGSVSCKSKSPKQLRERLIQFTKTHNGYVSLDNSTNDNGTVTYFLELRIPPAYFFDLVNQVSNNTNNISQKNIRAQDVTSEYADLDSRINTKKRLEIRYLDLLKKANKVSEMLEIEQAVGELRSDIESMEGEFKLMTNQIEFATLSVDFQLPTKIIEKQKEENKLVQSLKNGWEIWVNLFLNILSLWPIWIILFVVFLIIKKKLKAPTSIN